MKERLSQNLGLKAISVVIAFMIWILVVNISQPEVTAYQTVEIEVKNSDRLTSADKTYTLDTRTVRISYRVRSPQRGKIRAEHFKAYVDLADYSITGAVPVYYEVDDSVANLISDINVSPMVIHVDTEDIQRKRFELVTATSGKTMDGYMAGEISIVPDYIYVNGPISEVGQISEVGIEIDVSEANAALSGTAPVKFYDANGNEIEADSRITLSRSEINYELPVYRIKSLSVVADAVGTPADGYLLESVDSSPDFVDVYGPDEILNQYSKIEIPASELSVNGAASTVTRSVDITPYLPEGLRLAQPGREVTIAARVKKQPQVTLPSGETESSAADSEVVIETTESETAVSETAETGGTPEAESNAETETSAAAPNGPHTAKPSEEDTAETSAAGAKPEPDGAAAADGGSGSAASETGNGAE